MSDFVTISFTLLAQFTGGGAGVYPNIVPFVLGTVFWGGALGLALVQRSMSQKGEKLILWGFGLGVGREVFMLLISLLQVYGIVNPELLSVIFPPFERALFDAMVVVVASAFLQYLMQESNRAKPYLKVGLSTVLFCYLATFWWWGEQSISRPESQFGLTWCSWLFRINASALIIFPLFILIQNTRGRIRNAVCAGLVLFFLSESLKIPDMMTGEVYEPFFTSSRNAFYLIGILFFAYVYVQKLFDEQRKFKVKLIESEKTYRKLFEETRDVIYMTTPEGRFVDINKAGLQLFGYSKEEFLNIFSHALYVDPADREKMVREVRGKGVLQDYPLRLKKKNGSEMDCVAAISVRWGNDGKMLGYQGLIRDVSNEQLFEQHLRQTEKMEAMGTLAGGIAHDFNNILTAIIGYTFIASVEIDKDSEAQKALDQVLKAGNRAKELVKQILAFSRRDDQVKKTLFIHSIVKEAIKLLRATTPVSIDIVQDIGVPIGAVIAEPTQILQLLLNLCTNAVHAMGERGVLEIGVQDVTLEREMIVSGGILPVGNYVQVSVADNGTGMDQATLKRIFDPFFTTKRAGEGTGMGLSVVHGIVKGHGGQILVESTIGEGTVFKIFFPAVSYNSREENKSSKEYTGSESILFIDDEHTITKLAQMTLERFGYTVTTCVDGLEALEKFREDPGAFDLVITDQSMPGMSGSDLATEMLRMRPGLPIVLCTGFSKIIDQKKALEIGIREFVMKPVAEKKLAKVVRKVLDNSPSG